jgi:DNA-binding NarL/FixJ family response regulator
VGDRFGVLIVDDHPLVSEALRRLLSAQDDIEVVGVASTAQEAIRLAREHPPRVALMDSRLPDMSGAEAAAAIRAIDAEIAVLFLSGDDSDQAIFAAVESGAAGYLNKATTPGLVVESVRRVAAGELLIPARTLQRLIAAKQSASKTEAEKASLEAQFTPRERDVLRLMGHGHDNAAIAEQLFVELTTVRWHVHNILEKLGVHSKLEAVVRAAELGLL